MPRNIVGKEHDYPFWHNRRSARLHESKCLATATAPVLSYTLVDVPSFFNICETSGQEYSIESINVTYLPSVFSAQCQRHSIILFKSMGLPSQKPFCGNGKLRSLHALCFSVRSISNRAGWSRRVLAFFAPWIHMHGAALTI